MLKIVYNVELFQTNGITLSRPRVSAISEKNIILGS